MKPTCQMRGCRIDGEKVKCRGGYRHPECEKPARDRFPDRPLSAGEVVEHEADKREDARHSHEVETLETVPSVLDPDLGGEG